MSITSKPDQPSDNSRSSWRAQLRTRLSIRTQRRRWGVRAATWDRHNDVGMAKVAGVAIDMVAMRPDLVCVDLGCGGGRIALALARKGATVIGVDVSEEMIARATAQANSEGLEHFTGLVSPVEQLQLPEESVDVVITNYTLHHVRDEDKVKVVRAAFGWLRPGGEFIISDMMLGRGATAHDRKIIASKVKIMAKKGIPGYWRIIKNMGRFLFRVQERPITPEAWMQLFKLAGFVDTQHVNVVNEASVVKGTKPAA